MEAHRQRAELAAVPSEPHFAFCLRQSPSLCAPGLGTHGAAHLHLVEFALQLTMLARELPPATDVLFL